MKQIIFRILIISFVAFTGCKKKENFTSEEFRLKELELKEKELEIREKELSISKNDLSSKQSLSTIYENVKKSVYLIYTENASGISQGSAFVINKNGIAISNYHVFENASSAIAVNEFGDKFMISEVLEYDKQKDFIIFRLGNKDDIPFLKIASSIPKVGENVFAVGNPKGLTQTLSTGIISGFRNENTILQTTTSITHGSSGGPLFNEVGEVIGITTSGFNEANLNFAIDINNIPFREYLTASNSIGNETKSFTQTEIKSFIENYYGALSAENYNQLISFYSTRLSRFYDKFDITNENAVNFAKKYNSKFKIVSSNYEIRWNTLSSTNSTLGTEVNFTMDYTINRLEKNKPSKFVLNIIIVIDSDKKIRSIYEDIISKD